MWPDPGEALSRTVEAEAAIAALYAEAFSRWMPAAQAAALPVASGAVLAPAPASIAATQPAWDAVAADVIIAGLVMLWAASFVEASEGMGVALPGLPDVPASNFDAAATRIVAHHTGRPVQQVTEAVERVQAAPGQWEAANDYAETLRPHVAAMPAIVQARVEAEIRPPSTGVVEAQVEAQRATVEAVMHDASPEIRQLADREGLQAADVLNNAVVAAGRQSQIDLELEEPLHKCWISTLDAKCRPEHWAADGQRVPIDSYFTVGGEQMFVPGDKTASPHLWKNCRCRVGILAADEPLPDEVDRHTERLDGRDSVVVNRDGRTQQEEIERRRRLGNVRARDDQNGVGRVASGGWTAPSEQELTMADQDTYLTFTDVLFAKVGTPTSDNRVLSADTEMRFRQTPMPLRWCEFSKDGHDDAVVVGVIEQMSLNDKGEVRGSGYVLNNEHAVKALELVRHGVVKPSIDYMSVDVLEYEDGTPVTEENFDPNRPRFKTSRDIEVLAATLVSIPAFGQTTFALDPERRTVDRALVAAAAATINPPVYDPALFADPKLSGPTRITISEDGHVYGHLACWKDRHRTVGLGHINPPRSRSGYAHFHSSPGVHLSDGRVLPTGRLTVGIGHAATQGISNASAAAHYDNAAHCWALVRAGEDAHGIWVSGVVAPWASAEQVQMAMSAPLSGDWRPYGGVHELVAVLSVNTPGFLCAGDKRGDYALVASLGPSALTEAGGIEHLTAADIEAIVASALIEHDARRELAAQQAAASAARREASLARARELVGNPPLLGEFASRMPAQLKKYWLSGPGAAKVGWGSPGSYRRCLSMINAEVVEDGQAPLSEREIHGLCANLYHEATGRWPGKQRGKD